MKLSNKKAIVTGANRSIGKAIALAYANEGADVVISYRSDEKGAFETIQQIQKMGRQSKAIHADFIQEKALEKFFTQALDFLGHVDILVNNAAGYDESPFLNANVEKFEHILKLGVVIPMHLTQFVANHMVNQKIMGSIINISSISGLKPAANQTAHCTAKAAINMLTKTTALALIPHNIRVNAIAPGNTPYEESSKDEKSLKRAGKPQDHAHAAVFLASEDASWITGSILTVDGGQSIL